MKCVGVLLTDSFMKSIKMIGVTAIAAITKYTFGPAYNARQSRRSTHTNTHSRARTHRSIDAYGTGSCGQPKMQWAAVCAGDLGLDEPNQHCSAARFRRP